MSLPLNEIFSNDNVWKNNSILLRNRFPELFNLLKTEIDKVELALQNGTNPFPFWQTEKAKNGNLTVRENSILLHSGYNPEREAQQAASSFDSQNFEAALFLGFGLGYLPDSFCKTHKDKTIILVESEPLHFLASLFFFDWKNILLHKKCILAIGCSHQELLGIVNHFGIKNCVVFCQKNQAAHADSYFEGFQKLLERNRQKEEINSNTLERFASLWLKNNCRNLEKACLLDGINIYKDSAAKLDAVILAAGPSLKKVIPHLAEIKKRSILICVDTALRACLKAGVEPDFVILIDPQYWASRHIEGLKSASSVLITEGAAYPSVFRFKCRKTVVCSSLFPLGQYFEKKLALAGAVNAVKGKIDTGGSVATSAWDFARFIGAKRIFFAGLDLSYPEKNTHIKGSTFEEAAHKVSTRIKTAETQSSDYLFSIQTEKAFDYTGKPVLTDSRMKMFAWWFESRLASPDSADTYTFCPENLAIPGIKLFSLEDFLKTEIKDNEKKDFFEHAEKNSCENFSDEQKTELKNQFVRIKQELSDTLQNLAENAQKGYFICEKIISGSEKNIERALQKLQEIDVSISDSSVKEIVSLVFPTEKQLKRIFEEETPPDNVKQDKLKSNIFRSKIIYRELKKAISDYIKNLS